MKLSLQKNQILMEKVDIVVIFRLYLDAMKECGADSEPFNSFATIA